VNVNQEAPGTTLRKVLHCGAILTAICLVSGAGVGILYTTMKPQIAENEKRAFDTTLGVALGRYDEISELGQYPEGTADEEKVYQARAGSVVRYAAMGKAHGYQSTIKVLVSIEAARPARPLAPNPKIYRMAVVSSQETPGLGENIHKVQKEVSLWGALSGARVAEHKKRPSFQEQFSGLHLNDLPPCGEGMGEILPITGATITSKAVVCATRRAAEKIIEKTQEVYAESK